MISSKREKRSTKVTIVPTRFFTAEREITKILFVKEQLRGTNGIRHCRYIPLHYINDVSER